MRRRLVGAAIAASMFVGGAIGATVFSAGASSAANSASTPAASRGSVSGGPRDGSFKPIETNSHEASESKQREAQESAGKVPIVP